MKDNASYKKDMNMQMIGRFYLAKGPLDIKGDWDFLQTIVSLMKLIKIKMSPMKFERMFVLQFVKILYVYHLEL